MSSNLNLKTVDVGKNMLTKIDVHLLTELEGLSIYENQFTAINLYSNKKLITFTANDNQLKNLDFRENENLFIVTINDNFLENLNVKNGFNTLIQQFNVKGNPNLTCIEVDDVDFSNTNFTQKDNTANYSIDCAPVNDDCSEAIPLIFGQQTPGDINSGTFTNATDCVAGTIIADVWFSITVPQTGEFSIEGSGFGGLLKFALYESCASASSISCGLNISLTNLTPGTVYYLKVWMEASTNKSTNANADQGTFTLKASESSVLSVDDFITLNNDLIIYPNPTSNKLNIKTLNSVIEQVEIYNLQGKRVLKMMNFKDKKDINVSNLSKGIYFIKAKTENGIVSKKLVVN